MRSFRLKIALLSTLLSGAVLLGTGSLLLAVVYRTGMARVDREIRALGESQLRLRPSPSAARDFERSLRFVYGESATPRFVFKKVTRGGEMYRSPGWPEGLDDSRLPALGRPLRRALPGEPPLPGHPSPSAPPPRRRRGPAGFVPGEGGPPPERADPPRMREPSFATLQLADGTWRIGVMGHDRATVVLGADLTSFLEENHRYRNAFLAALPLVLALLAGGGYWVASRALRPVHAITATASRITARGLDERIPEVRSDRELARLVEVINGMLDRLAKSFRQAARFSADAAHELKTPLAVLQGQLEQALQEAADGSAEQRNYGELLAEVQRLRAIVRKLLLLAQADAGQMRGGHEIVAWSERVEEMAGDLSELAPHLAIHSRIAPGVTVPGDPDLLLQVLRNLTSNAVKFNRGDPGAIEIDLAVRGGQAVLAVANTGDALSREERGRLFERFYRGDPARSRKVDGVGLGLSLAREIVHAHGGTLAVDTERPGWVRFTLTLPLPPGPAGRAPRP